MRAYLAIALLIAMIGSHWCAYSAGVSREHDRLEAQYAKETAKAQAAAKAKEDALTAAYDKIAHDYEQGKRDAQVIADKFAADLRAERIRLRDRWTCPNLPGTETRSGEPDAAERDREESAGRIIRAAAECDQQVSQLQAIIRADRER